MRSSCKCLSKAADNSATYQLPIFLASPIQMFVKFDVRPFLRLFALLWLAFGMNLPVSAWTAHNAAHAAAQVNVDEHHHHEVDGRISVHEPEDGETPDGGHDHMPCILLGAVADPHAGVSLREPIVIRLTFAIPQSRGVERYASDGQRRPPRRG